LKDKGKKAILMSEKEVPSQIYVQLLNKYISIEITSNHISHLDFDLNKKVLFREKLFFIFLNITLIFFLTKKVFPVDMYQDDSHTFLCGFNGEFFLFLFFIFIFIFIYLFINE